MEQADSLATAFVPGHITGFFTSHTAGKPARTGSRGAGVTLTDGVSVTVSPGEGLRFNGTKTEIAPVGTVCDRLGVDAAIEVETSLPLGAGFGVSGAVCLGTAIAANAVFGCGKTENELIAIAHCAEVKAGTGLGDVVAQARGGMPIRIDPGAPSHNRLDGLPARPRIEYATFGELSTPAVLAEETEQLTRAGESALSQLLGQPGVETFMAASRAFAEEAALLTPTVETAIEAVVDAGGEAAMAMLGKTVFATGTGLSDADYEPEVGGVDAGGGRLVGDGDSPENERSPGEVI